MLGWSGCIAQGLAFRADDRLTFTSPKDRSTVSLPVVVEWDVVEFDLVRPGTPDVDNGGYFAVFVNRAPVPPGQTLHWVSRKDKSCRAAEGCPNTEYLNARGVYSTTRPRLVLEQIPRIRRDEDTTDWHRVTVVLLDPSGRRIGESAFEVSFHLRRDL